MEYTPKTDEEIKTLADDLIAGRIFTDRHIPESEMPQGLGMVFLTVALAGKETIEAWMKAKVTLFYEYLNQAGPRSVNGMPIFMSHRVLNVDDAARLFDLYHKMKAAMDAVKQGTK